MSAVLFFIAAIGALTGAIGVVMLRNPFYWAAAEAEAKVREPAEHTRKAKRRIRVFPIND